jgi:hypothetical protein
MKTGFLVSILRVRRFAVVALAFAFMAVTAARATTIFTMDLATGETTPSGDSTGPEYQLGFNGGAEAGITNSCTNGSLPPCTGAGNIIGYNFIFSSPSAAFNTGAQNDVGGVVKLPSSVIVDTADTQDGGYFLGLDSVYQTAAIDINISTVANQVYTVTFDWAATQQRGFMGSSSDFLTVMLGTSPAQVTNTLNVTEQGFTGCGTGWCSVTDTFTAGTTGNEVLSFLATGSGQFAGTQDPAMVLLDNINVSTGVTRSLTPEPSSLMLLSSGLLGLGGYVRWRTKDRAARKL